jgi:hypothetical protein
MGIWALQVIGMGMKSLLVENALSNFDDAILDRHLAFEVFERGFHMAFRPAVSFLERQRDPFISA